MAAQVDIGHCDALGVYSGVSEQGFDTTGQRFLRGYQFTSQFFFDDALTDQVHAREPYASKGQRDTRNSNEEICMGGGPPP